MSEKNFENKMLTDKELIEIVTRAPDEIECADAYLHFVEDLATLVTTHFGGDVDRVSPPEEGFLDEDEMIYRCDNCGKVHEEDEFVPLDRCRHLFERLTPGGKVPDGECTDCGAFVYREKREIDSEYIAVISHNECVPADGWVYSKYDPDIDWNNHEEEETSE